MFSFHLMVAAPSVFYKLCVTTNIELRNSENTHKSKSCLKLTWATDIHHLHWSSSSFMLHYSLYVNEKSIYFVNLWTHLITFNDNSCLIENKIEHLKKRVKRIVSINKSGIFGKKFVSAVYPSLLCVATSETLV